MDSYVTGKAASGGLPCLSPGDRTQPPSILEPYRFQAGDLTLAKRSKRIVQRAHEQEETFDNSRATEETSSDHDSSEDNASASTSLENHDLRDSSRHHGILTNDDETFPKLASGMSRRNRRLEAHKDQPVSNESESSSDEEAASPISAKIFNSSNQDEPSMGPEFMPPACKEELANKERRCHAPPTDAQAPPHLSNAENVHLSAASSQSLRARKGKGDHLRPKKALTRDSPHESLEVSQKAALEKASSSRSRRLVTRDPAADYGSKDRSRKRSKGRDKSSRRKTTDVPEQLPPPSLIIPLTLVSYLVSGGFPNLHDAYKMYMAVRDSGYVQKGCEYGVNTFNRLSPVIYDGCENAASAITKISPKLYDGAATALGHIAEYSKTLYAPDSSSTDSVKSWNLMFGPTDFDRACVLWNTQIKAALDKEITFLKGYRKVFNRLLTCLNKSKHTNADIMADPCYEELQKYFFGEYVALLQSTVEQELNFTMDHGVPSAPNEIYAYEPSHNEANPTASPEEKLRINWETAHNCCFRKVVFPIAEIKRRLNLVRENYLFYFTIILNFPASYNLPDDMFMIMLVRYCQFYKYLKAKFFEKKQFALIRHFLPQENLDSWRDIFDVKLILWEAIHRSKLFVSAPLYSNQVVNLVGSLPILSPVSNDGTSSLTWQRTQHYGLDTGDLFHKKLMHVNMKLMVGRFAQNYDSMKEDAEASVEYAQFDIVFTFNYVMFFQESKYYMYSHADWYDFAALSLTGKHAIFTHLFVFS